MGGDMPSDATGPTPQVEGCEFRVETFHQSAEKGLFGRIKGGAGHEVRKRLLHPFSVEQVAQPATRPHPFNSSSGADADRLGHGAGRPE